MQGGKVVRSNGFPRLGDGDAEAMIDETSDTAVTVGARVGTPEAVVNWAAGRAGKIPIERRGASKIRSIFNYICRSLC